MFKKIKKTIRKEKRRNLTHRGIGINNIFLESLNYSKFYVQITQQEANKKICCEKIVNKDS